RPMVLMTKRLTEEPVAARKRNPKVSKPLDALVAKMMAKEKDKRYQTPIELLEDMERVLAGRPIESGSASGRSKQGKEEGRQVNGVVKDKGGHKAKAAAAPGRTGKLKARRTPSPERGSSRGSASGSGEPESDPETGEPIEEER